MAVLAVILIFVIGFIIAGLAAIGMFFAGVLMAIVVGVGKITGKTS